MNRTLDNNEMNAEQIQNWTLASFISGLFTAIYNGLSDWGVNEWVAVIGVIGMIVSLLMQRHYNRRRDQREAEKHEWQRRAFAQKLREQDES